jgi:hypothetical protein
MQTLLLLSLLLLPPQAEPIRLHPENPHYFQFRGKPTVLITSGEHYGAVLNQDFDYVPYLKALEAHGLNLTRVFSGVYREVPGSFNIKANTLAPKDNRYLSPWARNGDKFDLDRWDEAYFRRLKDFLTEAGHRGIVVEYVLFCPFYEDSMWNVSPMNAKNNVSGVGNCPRVEAYTLKHAKLEAHQDAFVRKVVEELKDFDNVYFEICNEPYFGGVTLEWQAHIADTIADAEKNLPHRHLIAQNIANGKAKVERPHPAVSILNFHYATPPETVGMNYGLNKAVGDDETGFRGTSDRVYRSEAWEFLLAGGSVFDNLDYSFTVDHPDGTAEVHDPTPGGGGPTFRSQMKVLREFLSALDFVHMTPDTKSIRQVTPQDSAKSLRCLSQPGKAYAVYVNGGKQLTLNVELPRGRYQAEWLDPRSGKVAKEQPLDHGGGTVELVSPEFGEDIALRILALPK